MPRKTKTPNRADDNRITLVICAWKRFAESPARDSDLLDRFMQDVVGFNWYGWPDERLREILDVVLLNAPDGDLDLIVEDALAKLAWLDCFEKQVAAEVAA